VILDIDGKQTIIPAELTDEAMGEAWLELLKTYDELDDTLRMGLKILARKILSSLEKKQGNRVFRPAKGQDPTLHLAGILFTLWDGLVQHACIEITTESPEHTTATTLALSVAGEGEGWRQVVSSRHDGNGQNNLLEETAASLDEALPDVAVVRAR
jgi:hypothetical protein